MDIYIFIMTVGLALIFTYLFLLDKSNLFLVIAAGILFILSGLPLVGMDTLNYPICEHVVNATTITTIGNTSDASFTYYLQCTRDAAQIDWKLQEAIGAFFLLIGLGLTLSIFSDRRKTEEQ